MDWLRSEDLKEEKVLTTSKVTITRQGAIYLFRIDLMTVSVRHWSYAPQAGFRLKVRKCREFAWRAGEPWLGRQTMLRGSSGLLPERNWAAIYAGVLAFGSKMEADESGCKQ